MIFLRDTPREVSECKGPFHDHQLRGLPWVTTQLQNYITFFGKYFKKTYMFKSNFNFQKNHNDVKQFHYKKQNKTYSETRQLRIIPTENNKASYLFLYLQSNKAVEPANATERQA